jgi:hypothetical protein
MRSGDFLLLPSLGFELSFGEAYPLPAYNLIYRKKLRCMHSSPTRIVPMTLIIHFRARTTRPKNRLAVLAYGISIFFQKMRLRSPHRLQLLQDEIIRIHEPIDAVLHARFFVFVQFARRDFGGYAFAETHVC